MKAIHSFSLFSVALVASMVSVTTLTYSGQLEDMAAEIEALKVEVAELEGKNTTVVQVADRIQSAKDQMEEMKKSLVEKEKEVSQLEYLLGAYRAGFRFAPKIGNGDPLGTFQTTDGRTFENALFAGFDRGSLKMVTKGGIVTVPLEQIPAQYSKYFNLPGAIPVAENSLQSLQALRPALDGEAPKVAMVSSGGEEKGESSQEAKEAPAEEENAAQKAEREQQERSERNKKRLVKVEELKAQSKKMLLEIVKMKREKRQREADLKGRKIRMDPKKIESELGFYDFKIDQLTAQEQKLKEAIMQLRLALE